MPPKNILLIGVKGSVIAFDKVTGAQLWATRLKSNDFVTVTADETRVYAHTRGELFCVDLQTGNSVWQNELAGYGYGVASLALPGMPGSPATAIVEKERQDEAVAASTASTAG